MVCREFVSSTRLTRWARDFEHAVDTLRKRLNAKPVPIQIPIGQEDKFKGVVDSVNMNAILWNDETLGLSTSPKKFPPI